MNSEMTYTAVRGGGSREVSIIDNHGQQRRKVFVEGEILNLDSSGGSFTVTYRYGAGQRRKVFILSSNGDVNAGNVIP